MKTMWPRRASHELKHSLCLCTEVPYPVLFRAIIVVLAVLCIHRSARGQLFTEIDPSLPAPPRPCLAIGDYDGDGDLDLLLAGSGKHDSTLTVIYKNNGGIFTDSGIILTPLEFGAAAWGDFDGDGDLDLAMIGETNARIPTTRVYRNDGATFTAVNGPFTGVFAGTVSWADYDNDGDLDLLVTGVTGSAPGSPAATRLYRNDRGSFVTVPHPFPDVYLGPVSWGDYDNDGDLDVIVTGTASSGALAATLWRNDGAGNFTDAGSNFPALDLGFATWGDFDSDGDLDLLFGGNSTDGWITRIYRNDAGQFLDSAQSLVGTLWSSAAWGDANNDGTLDIMLIGYEPVGQTNVSRLYRNDYGRLVEAGQTFHNLFLGAVNWFDYDEDGDLDLLLAGNSSSSLGDFLGIYRNNSPVLNTPPGPPSGLAANVEGTTVALSWNPGSDKQTAAAALTYNVRVGLQPGGSEILPGQSTPTGHRLVPAPGNASHRLNARLVGLQAGLTYYWSVQTVDTAFAGSPFAIEGTFTAGLNRPHDGRVVRDAEGTLHLTWRGSAGITYLLEESTTLNQWTAVKTGQGAPGSGLIEFVTTPAPTASSTFYRVRVEP